MVGPRRRSLLSVEDDGKTLGELGLRPHARVIVRKKLGKKLILEAFFRRNKVEGRGEVRKRGGEEIE